MGGSGLEGYLAQSTERRREDMTEDGGEETVEQGEGERSVGAARRRGERKEEGGVGSE